MRKLRMRKFVTLLLAGIMVVSLFSPITGTGILKAMAAKPATFTISKDDETTATKIHSLLMSKKEFQLKVNGGPKTANKKLGSLNKKIRKINGQGVIFHAALLKKKGNCSLFEVSSENVKLYRLSLKFVSKLYKGMRENVGLVSDEVVNAYIADSESYPDMDTRKMHIYYDMFIRFIQENPTLAFSRKYAGEATPSQIRVIGADEGTCKIVPLMKDSGFAMKHLVYDTSLILKDATVNENQEGILSVKSFSEFAKTSGIEGKVKGCSCWMQYFSTDEPWKNATSPGVYTKKGAFLLAPQTQHLIILKEKDFGNLSDAMKIWAIGKSGYFSCSFSRPAYGMLYSAAAANTAGGSAGMKLLYQNKAAGVCSDFAQMESLLFKVLNITHYYRSNFWMNHSWTVVKVKNSNGKTLWIPFDYGIGPSALLDVPEDVQEALSTEAERYKIFLEGIKGAPAKKNFTTRDFN